MQLGTLDSRHETLAGLARFELWQRDTVAAVFEHDFDRHVDFDLLDGTTDDVAAKARAVVQINPGGDIGNVGTKAAERGADDFTNDREAKDFAFAADLHPVEFFAGAIAAHGTRRKHPGRAVGAFLHHQFAGFGAIPEGLVDRRYFG